MAAELGGKQLSTLLESLPGIASVLRSPVADAMVNLIRAAVGIEEFREADARELVQYATRRGLMGADEGTSLLAEVHAARKRGGRKAKRPTASKARRAGKSTAKRGRKSVPAKKAVARKTTVKKAKAKKTRVKKPVAKRKPAARKTKAKRSR